MAKLLIRDSALAGEARPSYVMSRGFPGHIDGDGDENGSSNSAAAPGLGLLATQHNPLVVPVRSSGSGGTIDGPGPRRFSERPGDEQFQRFPDISRPRP